MKPDLALRAILTVAGALAGLSAWLIAEQLPMMIDNIRGLMVLGVFAGLLFAVFMVATGPLRPMAALIAALAVAVPSTLLFLLASFRYRDPGTYLEAGLPIVALLFGAGIGVPFVITALARRGNWSDYATLFTEAWYIFTRTTAAMVFMGLVWAVILLSDQMMQLVGLNFVEDILEIDAVPAVITGAALGIALAVVHELSAYVTPYLILRLLRLLLPLVLAVSTVFVVAMPFRGLSELNSFFGSLSAGFVLMSMAFGGLTLVTVAIDQRDEDAVSPGWMQWATKALAVLSPVLAGLAVWSVSLRVGQYGWTPHRLAAMTAAVVLLGYGLGYVVAVVRGNDWMHRIRRANVWMALVTLVIAALWLTPLFNAERISVASQMARLESGKVSVESFDLWSVGREWGRAGEAAVERLKAMNLPEQEKLTERISRMEKALYRYEFESTEPVTPLEPVDVAALLARIPVLPAGSQLPQQIAAVEDMLRRVENACARQTLSGLAACVVVQADFLTAKSGDEWIALFDEYGGGASVVLLWVEAGLVQYRELPYQSAETLDRVAKGEFTVAAPDIQVLESGGQTILPQE